MINRPLRLVFILSLLLSYGKTNAQNRLCQSYEAAYNLEARMREGMSLKQAKVSIVKDEYSDGSSSCFSEIKHEISRMPYAFPLVYEALYKRTRR